MSVNAPELNRREEWIAQEAWNAALDEAAKKIEIVCGIGDESAIIKRSILLLKE